MFPSANSVVDRSHLGLWSTWVHSVCGVREGCSFLPPRVAVQLTQHHLLKRQLFPSLNCLDTLVENQLTTNVRVYFWTVKFYFICPNAYPYASATLSCLVWLTPLLLVLPLQKKKGILNCGPWSCLLLDSVLKLLESHKTNPGAATPANP